MHSNHHTLLLKLLSNILLLPLSTYILLSFFPLPLPAFIPIILALSIPFLPPLLNTLKRTHQRRKLGAQSFKSITSRWPFGLSIMHDMIHEAEYGYLGTQVTQWFEKENTKTFEFNVMGDRQIVTIEPDYIKRVLATEFNNFKKGYRWINAATSVLGVGVFNADDEMWKFHRGMTRPFFSRERISDFELFGRHADLAISKIKTRLAHPSRPAFDFQDLVSRFTMDSATEFLFGSCVHSLDASLPYPHNHHNSNSNKEDTHASDLFAQSFAAAQFQISQRSRIGYIWPLFELTGDKTRKDMKTIMDFIDPIIQDRLDARKNKIDIEAKAGDALQNETLLDHLIERTDNKEILKDETVNIMVAGRDTTACLLTFSVYMLSKHPDILARLRAEILEHVGPTRAPTFNDIKDMKYLRAFLNEVLRLYPPVPFDIRSSVEPTTWPSTVPGEKPFFVPGNQNIVYSAYIMHRTPSLWGPTALQFDPARFLDQRVSQYLTPNPFIFLPFNAGPRICLGQQFAYNESSFFLVRLLQAFAGVELVKGAMAEENVPPLAWKALEGRGKEEDVWLKSHLTMSVKGGLWVRMTE